MTTIEQVIGQTRALLGGPLSDDVSTLATAYNPGDQQIVLTYERRMAPNSVLCAGLTTFQVLAVTGTSAGVLAGLDGSPTNQLIPAGTPVYVRPRHTTWQVFTEISATTAELCSPVSGLYEVRTSQQPSDSVDGTYPLTERAQRVIRVRYLQPGTLDDWTDMPWQYRVDASGVPVVESQSAPGGTIVEIVAGHGFTEPQSLDDTLTDLGMLDHYAQILAVGAARNLSLSSESRRAQPFSQGDPRIARDVPSTANVVVYDRLRRRFTDLVDAERTRLNVLWPWRKQMEAYGGRR